MRIEIPHTKPPSIRLAPLIDVVFILLVFFMLASSFLDWRAFDLSLPPPDATPDPEANPVVVEVAADGALAVGGQDVTGNELADRVRERVREDPERTVVIRSADDAPVRATVDALNRLQAGGIDSASLAEEAP